MRVLLLFSIVVATTVSTLATGQIAARQGAPDTTDQYRSPMVLELPLPPMAPHRTPLSRDLGRFTCEGVSLEAFAYLQTEITIRKRKVFALQFVGWVKVPESFDREVDVAVVLTSGGEVLGKGAKTKIDAEEGRLTAFSFDVPVDRDRLNAARAADVPPRVEITVTVRDNS